VLAAQGSSFLFYYSGAAILMNDERADGFSALSTPAPLSWAQNSLSIYKFILKDELPCAADRFAIKMENLPLMEKFWLSSQTFDAFSLGV